LERAIVDRWQRVRQRGRLREEVREGGRAKKRESEGGGRESERDRERESKREHEGERVRERERESASESERDIQKIKFVHTRGKKDTCAESQQRAQNKHEQKWVKNWREKKRSQGVLYNGRSSLC
jgi:hypothetical protein